MYTDNRLPFSILSLRIRFRIEVQWVIVKPQSITVVDEVEHVSEVSFRVSDWIGGSERR